MSESDMRYTTVVLPYQFGMKHGFINRDIVEQQFKENTESLDMLLAEYMAIPERGTVNGFYKYSSLAKCQTNAKALFSMSDSEFIEYKNKQDWKFYQPKLPNEVRVMAVDIALIESKKNDNTAIWIIRLIPNGEKYKKISAYCESMHGINAIIQAKRVKQLFYELDCDWCVLDTQGNGAGVYDNLTAPTYDNERGITYPAWTVKNPEDVKMNNRALQISNNAIPLIYSVKTPPDLLYNMIINSKNIIDREDIDLLVDTDDAIEYLNQYYEFYNIEDSEVRARLLNPYVQTRVFINEAINLEQYAQGGYIKLKEKSGRRKDRVMALVYGLWYCVQLEDDLKKQDNTTLLDWLIFM